MSSVDLLQPQASSWAAVTSDQRCHSPLLGHPASRTKSNSMPMFMLRAAYTGGLLTSPLNQQPRMQNQLSSPCCSTLHDSSSIGHRVPTNVPPGHENPTATLPFGVFNQIRCYCWYITVTVRRRWDHIDGSILTEGQDDVTAVDAVGQRQHQQVHSWGAATAAAYGFFTSADCATQKINVQLYSR